MAVAPHPCCILTGIGPLKPPSEQSFSMQDARLEISGTSPGSPGSLPAAAGEKTLPHFEYRCRRMAYGTRETPCGQSCSFHDEHLEAHDSSSESAIVHPVASAEPRC